jgi:hypothetical protein
MRTTVMFLGLLGFLFGSAHGSVSNDYINRSAAQYAAGAGGAT